MTLSSSQPPAGTPVLSTIKYALPELLAEIQWEKQAGNFVAEKLPQADIARVFQVQLKPRRGKPSQ